MTINLLSTCGVYVSSQMLENKTLRSQGQAQSAKKHSLKAQGSESMIRESRKETNELNEVL